MAVSRFDLSEFTNEALLKRIKGLSRHAARLMADLLANLAEVDTRKLYLALGHSSMFSYCVERLKYSEDEASRRIHAMRVARTFPRVLELVAEGRLHLTAVNVLAPHLRPDNFEELLTAACGLSKRQLAGLVADRFPQPEAPAYVRAIPLRREARAAAGPATGSGAESPGMLDAKDFETELIWPRASVLVPISRDRAVLHMTVSRTCAENIYRAQELLRHRDPGISLESVVELAAALQAQDLERELRGHRRRRAGKLANPPGVDALGGAGGTAPGPLPEGDSGKVAPEQTHSSPEITSLSAPAQVTGVVTEACSSSSAGDTNTGESSSDVASVAAAANSEVATLEARDASEDSPAPDQEEPTEGAIGAERSRHVPVAVRDAVVERDGGRCTFIGSDGFRCTARALVQFDHRRPVAQGGPHTAENGRLLCAAHNRFEAERVLGPEKASAWKRWWKKVARGPRGPKKG